MALFRSSANRTRKKTLVSLNRLLYCLYSIGQSLSSYQLISGGSSQRFVATGW